MTAFPYLHQSTFNYILHWNGRIKWVIFKLNSSGRGLVKNSQTKQYQLQTCEWQLDLLETGTSNRKNKTLILNKVPWDLSEQSLYKRRISASTTKNILFIVQRHHENQKSSNLRRSLSNLERTRRINQCLFLQFYLNCKFKSLFTIGFFFYLLKLSLL